MKDHALFIKMQKFVEEAFKGFLYDGHPYTIHTSDVVRILIKHQADLATVLAGGLHDAKEDVGISHETLAAEFGEEVALIVDKVTDRPGKNRKERHLATYPITRSCPKAVMVKLADRISNMSYCLKTKGPKASMYVKEYIYFKSVLYKAGEYDEMWAELDALSLRLAA